MTSPTQGKKPSIVGIVVSPVETCRRIRERPVFWGAFFSLLIISSLLFGVIGYYQVNDPKFFEMMQRQMPEQFQNLTEADQQAAMEFIKVSSLIGNVVSGGVATLLIPLFGAIFLKLIFLFMKHKKVVFRQLFSLQIHIYTISVLAIFVHACTLLIANGDPVVAPTSLAGIIPVPDGLGKAILQGFEFFTIWSLIILKVGLVEVAQLSSKRAWVITSVFFLLFLGLQVSVYMMSYSMQ